MLDKHKHPRPAPLSVSGICDEVIFIEWEQPDPRTKSTWGEKATEFAGECIGIALCEKLTEFNVVERSFINSGFDFWLGMKRDMLFQRKASLELSGIDQGSPAQVDARVRKIEQQVSASSATRTGEVLIVVSEFKSPIAKVVRHA